MPQEDYRCAQYNAVKLFRTLWEFWGGICCVIRTVGEVELVDDNAGQGC